MMNNIDAQKWCDMFNAAYPVGSDVRCARTICGHVVGEYPATVSSPSEVIGFNTPIVFLDTRKISTFLYMIPEAIDLWNSQPSIDEKPVENSNAELCPFCGATPVIYTIFGEPFAYCPVQDCAGNDRLVTVDKWNMRYKLDGDA